MSVQTITLWLDSTNQTAKKYTVLSSSNVAQCIGVSFVKNSKNIVSYV